MVYWKIDLKKETKNPDEKKIKDELILHGMNRAAEDKIEYNTIGTFQTTTVTRLYIILFNGQVMHIPYRKNIHFMHSILQL